MEPARRAATARRAPGIKLDREDLVTLTLRTDIKIPCDTELSLHLVSHKYLLFPLITMDQNGTESH